MAWADSDYGYKRKITIQNGKVSGDEVDFPILLSVTYGSLADTANGGHVQSSNGYDIVFYDATETTLLSHEIEEYVNTTGQLIFWVKINSLSSTLDTIFYMYYGKAGVAVDPSSTNTWDVNYAMVQHMSDATSNTILDSTSNDKDGTKQGVGHPLETSTAKIYEAQHFDGTQDYILLANDSFETQNTGTIEAWIKRDIAAKDGDCIFSTSVAGVGNLMRLTVFENSGFDLLFQHYKDGVGWNDVINGNTVLGTGWHHVAITSDGSHWNFYVDGADDGENVAGGANSGRWFNDLAAGNHVVKIGSMVYGPASTSTFFDGIEDEVRISSVNRSPNWLSTTFNTEGSPSTFLIVSGEETSGIAGNLHLLLGLGSGGVQGGARIPHLDMGIGMKRHPRSRVH